MTRILITVPHAKCSLVNRFMPKQTVCEPLAVEVANRINEKLIERGIESNVMIGRVPRTVLDLNRAQARMSPFRRQVDKALTKNTLLLDIHVSPSGAFGGYQMLVFDMPTTRDNTLVKNMVQDLRAQGIKVKRVPASDVNDIVMSALSRSVNAVLLEFNETVDAEVISTKVVNMLAGE